MKIRIMGGAGSGKTYLGKKLAERLGIRCHELDHLYWDNKGLQDGTKADPKHRDKQLQKILKKKRWIIEGTYWKHWVQDTFSQADMVIFLQVNRYKRNYTMLKRHLKRRLDPHEEKESLKEFLKVFVQSWTWDRRGEKIKRMLQKKHNVQCFSSADEALRQLTQS